MNSPVIEIQQLNYRYGKRDALRGLDLLVQSGQCYGFFGRNGAGKTTAIKCLLNLVRPESGSVRVFGLDPRVYEVATKLRIAYVPDFVAFYPWMNVAEALSYQASFRPGWNSDMEHRLLQRFQLDPTIPCLGLSKGQRTQLALIGAIASEPELLILDEPTSGLDPLVRRDFIQTVIGAFQDSGEGKRTVLVSTHLISEFEGLIDRFTIVEEGRAILTADADEARSKFRRIRAVFDGSPPNLSEFSGAKSIKVDGRQVELVVNGNGDAMIHQIRERRPISIETEALTLEEIFLIAVKPKEKS